MELLELILVEKSKINETVCRSFILGSGDFINGEV